MSSRRQRSIPLCGRYKQVSLYVKSCHNVTRLYSVTLCLHFFDLPHRPQPTNKHGSEKIVVYQMCYVIALSQYERKYRAKMHADTKIVVNNFAREKHVKHYAHDLINYYGRTDNARSVWGDSVGRLGCANTLYRHLTLQDGFNCFTRLNHLMKTVVLVNLWDADSC